MVNSTVPPALAPGPYTGARTGDAPPPRTPILMSEFWSDCLSLLKQKLSVQQYDAWIRPLSAREADGKLLVWKELNYGKMNEKEK